MKLTVAAALCGLAVLYLYVPDQTSGLLASRRRYTDTSRRRTILTTRRRTYRSGGFYPGCLQQYICTRKYMDNNTLYSMDYTTPPVTAIEVNLCRAGGTTCSYKKNCRPRYLTDGKTLTTNLDAWTATHWGNGVTTEPRPESVQVCDSAPGGMSQKGTVMTIVISVTLGLVTGLCFF
ncbi:uncharacterized protein LOC118420618 [Branchiostoma floridae]|uniref:Uncharacterized protein LOC118420618 n=1 Tax=Branchiostoma floridae TaxID=7739 RepID=A0A9J7LJR5_BRAFL|nr:uncharacterized protein LOC118420618 [Branchiostoma floridae]